MKIASDKLGHLKAGVVAALAGALMGIVISLVASAALGLHGPSVHMIYLLAAASGAVSCGVAAGVTKEIADALDNRIRPGMHGVEAADAVFTALPGFALGLALVGIAGRASGAW